MAGFYSAPDGTAPAVLWPGLSPPFTAWAQPGHVIVSDPGLLWIGDGIDDIVRMLEAAGAVLRVVPQVVA